MKRFALINLFFFFFASFAIVNAQSDSIAMKKVFGGYQFSQHGKALTMPGLVKAMEGNEQAHKEIIEAKSTYSTAMVLGLFGGGLIGWPIGTAMGGGDPQWALAGVGVGLLVISIPVVKKFNKQADKAINTFNGGLSVNRNLYIHELELAILGNGIGFRLKF